MWLYIARRLLWIPFLLLGASIVTFTLGHYGPGDPVVVMLQEKDYGAILAAARLR